MMQCSHSDKARDFSRGNLDADLVPAILRHIQTCSACRETALSTPRFAEIGSNAAFDPTNYLPSDALVSFVVGRSTDFSNSKSGDTGPHHHLTKSQGAFDECLADELLEGIAVGTESEARNDEELLHLIACAGCQAAFEGAITGRTDGEPSFLPSEILVRRVLQGVVRRRPRFRFPNSLVGEEETAHFHPSLRRRAATVALALGLSPAILAAVVVMHLAAFTVASMWAMNRVWDPLALPHVTAVEHVQLVHLDVASVTAIDRVGAPTPRSGLSSKLAADLAYRTIMRRELTAAVAQQISGTSSGGVTSGDFSAAEQLKLRETAHILRRFQSVSIRVEFDSTVPLRRAVGTSLRQNSTRARALAVQEYLTQNGAVSDQIRLIAVDAATVCKQRMESCARAGPSLVISLNSLGNLRLRR